MDQGIDDRVSIFLDRSPSEITAGNDRIEHSTDELLRLDSALELFLSEVLTVNARYYFTMTTIVHDNDIRSSDPALKGLGLRFFDIKQRVIDNGEDPHIVADEYDISLANLFYALAYYYKHCAALNEREIDAARREGKRQTRGILEQAENGTAETGGRAD